MFRRECNSRTPTISMIKKPSSKSIQITTSARLHMGFLDLNGGAGRWFGSLGVSLKAPETKVVVARGKQLFDAQLPEYVEKLKQTMVQHLNLEDEVSVRVDTQIPRHAGLGSGTQMALSVGVGISRLFGLDLTLEEIASIAERGLRSGIGVGAFSTGGVLLDGGRGKNTTIPPIMARYAFPKAWRILLIFDQSDVGVHGQAEKIAFKQLKPASTVETQAVCHAILMQALPALIEQDLMRFGQAVAKMQAYTGDYFAPIQDGRYASKTVTKVLNFLMREGVDCVGQSSWGPTGFAIFESQSVAEQHLTTLKATFQQESLDWLICEANNQGASVL